MNSGDELRLLISLAARLMVVGRLAREADGLTCYYCRGSSYYTTLCNDPFDGNQTNVKMRTCTGDLCYTVKFKNAEVIRTCIFKSTLDPECVDYDEARMCSCNTELCNHLDISPEIVNPVATREDFVQFKTYVSRHLPDGR